MISIVKQNDKINISNGSRNGKTFAMFTYSVYSVVDTTQRKVHQIECVCVAFVYVLRGCLVKVEVESRVNYPDRSFTHIKTQALNINKR